MKKIGLYNLTQQQRLETRQAARNELEKTMKSLGLHGNIYIFFNSSARKTFLNDRITGHRIMAIGSTTIKITTLDNETIKILTIWCSSRDVYDRVIGEIIALKRANKYLMSRYAITQVSK